jgi:hypothetical protein
VRRCCHLSFKDSSCLLEWVAKGPAVVTFRDIDEAMAKSAALKDLVKEWITATRSNG